jgi:hypothetical protein
MKKVHIVIPDLFLPKQLAAYASADLSLPALEKVLTRAQVSSLEVDTPEAWLCEQFGLASLAIAPLTLQADGVSAGDSYWLRADPVGITMQREQMVLQADVSLNADEAAALCASLNTHFAADGLKFVAPHPQRWYVQLEHEPALQTHALPQVVGADIHAHLPTGEHALRWHSVFNEIQMLFYEHAVNLAREQRGELAVSGIWLWGGGKFPQNLSAPFTCVAGDSDLAQAFAQAAGLSQLCVSDNAQLSSNAWQGDLLLLWEGMRSALQHADIAQWRSAVMQFEKSFMAPLLAELYAGKLEQITLDALNEGATRRFVLTRGMLWKIWRSPKPLLHYALSPTEE